MKIKTIIVMASVLLLFASAPLMRGLAKAQTQYSVTIWSWDYQGGWNVPVQITKDGVQTGLSTPQTFFDLTGTHNFTVPTPNAAGHVFSDWDMSGNNWTDPTITVSSGGTYTARYRAGYSVTIWGWDYIQGWAIPVPISIDGTSSGFSTPHTFTDLTGPHTFTVPYTNTAGHPFSEWSNDWTDPILEASSAGVYTARYREGYSVTIRAWCVSALAWMSRPITLDGFYTGFTTPYTFYLIGTHTIEVPSNDEDGDPFVGWDEGASSSPTLTVYSAGVFTAKYRHPPIGSIVINGGATYTTSTSVTLSLTYQAYPFGSTVSQVRYSNDGVWDTEVWETPAASKAWVLPSASGDGVKAVYFQVKDSWGLSSPTYEDTIILDTTPPAGSIVINGGAAYTNSTGVTLTLTYSDGLSGVSQVRYSNDGTSWTAWEAPVSTKAWVLDQDPNWGNKTVYFQVRDSAGTLSSIYSDLIILDTADLKIWFDIDNNAVYASSTTVTLRWTKTMSGISNISWIRYSNDGNWDDEPWESFISQPPFTKTWTMTPGDGTKTVYCQIKSEAGFTSPTANDTIILDTTPPTGTITINNGASLTSSTSATLNLIYADALSGVSQVRYSNDGVWDSESWEPPSATKAWTLTAGDGTKTVYYQIKDNAGLTSTTYTDTITLQTQGSPWTIETVDSAGDVGATCSLSLDPSGYPCISYLDTTNFDLKFARWNGTAWNIETVDSAGSVGLYTSLVFDTNGYPHISYQDGTNYNLKYAKWTGTEWSIETVDSSVNNVGGYSSLALDSNGYPHISYNDYTDGDLKYAKWTGTEWSIQTVDSAGIVGMWVSLDLDQNNYPCISYNDATNWCLKYAKWTGSAWNIQTVDTAGGVETSLILDSNGYPHISYNDRTNSFNLKYAKWTGTEWSIQIVAWSGNSGEIGESTSLAFDLNGNPCISYCDYNNWDLKYAKWIGATWSIETVDSVGEVGLFTFLVFDSGNHPHISYYDRANRDLKYAYGQIATPIDTTPPTGSITVNGGATTTNSASVGLTLSATDAESGVTQMRLSNDNTWDTETWEAYSESKSWTLASGDGAKTVYAQFKNGAGLESPTYSDSITLQSFSADTTPPTGSVTINGGAATTSSVSVTLTLSATDNSGTVAQMRFANIGESWTTWEPYTTTKAWTLTPGTGTKTVLAQFKDGSGIESAPYGDTIILDTSFEEKTFNVTVGSSTYAVTTRSNSSVSDFAFNQVLKRIRFSTNGTAGTAGFCNITIPAALMWGDFSLFMDDAVLVKDVGYTQTYNGTHYLFRANYPHNVHVMEIFSTSVIPEFPSAATLVLFAMLASVLAAKFGRKNSLFKQPGRRASG